MESEKRRTRGGVRPNSGRKKGSKNSVYTDKTFTYSRRVTPEEYTKLDLFLSALRSGKQESIISD